ncbi:MAG: hypothetical protein V1802_00555 [Candidatus Aenigmatarchaeota archaeon]
MDLIYGKKNDIPDFVKTNPGSWDFLFHLPKIILSYFPNNYQQEVENMETKKIDEYIKQTGIKPKDCMYHTNRTAKNSKQQPSGNIRVLVAKADGVARCEYVCPECGHYAYCEQEWKRPFSVKCEKCGFKISVPKLREELKREKKQEKLAKMKKK